MNVSKEELAVILTQKKRVLFVGIGKNYINICQGPCISKASFMLYHFYCTKNKNISIYSCEKINYNIIKVQKASELAFGFVILIELTSMVV